MLEHIKLFGKTHIFYIILIVMGFIAFRSWLVEHDTRLQAEGIVKQQEAKVADLQQQIVSVNAAATQKVQIVTKIVHDAQTPSQVVQAIPQLTTVPLNARVSPDNPAQVAVDALPLVQVLGQCRQDAIQLSACQQTSALKDEQLQAKDVEIKALKKKPSFWARIKSHGKAAILGAVALEVVKFVLTKQL